MSKAPSFIRAGAAAVTLSTLISGAALFALPAVASNTSGAQGFDYHIALASEAGTGVMAADPSTGDAAYYGTTGASDQATPASQSVTIDQNAAVSSETSAAGYSIAEVIGWAALFIAAMLIIAAIWSFVDQSRVEHMARTRRRAVYQG